MPQKTKLFYIDDSGSEKHGLAVLGWIEVDIEDWALVLSEILEWREELSREHSIPKSYELHAVNFVNGRGNPSTNDAWNRKKFLRQQITDELFTRISQWSICGVGRIMTQTTARRHAFAQVSEELYATFIQTLDEKLSANNEQAIIIIDGDGTNRSYARAHRKLSLETRSIIEDPLFQHSHTSLLVQIADFVAYAAFQNQIKQPNKEFSWNWYSTLEQSSG
jgi:hypothetical protein